jgi:antitoxin component HigA of HigAB toxin-antitoxin module/mRNA-degrading endonuclease HigB of HigAB toxin-antitoxin module
VRIVSRKLVVDSVASLAGLSAWLDVVGVAAWADLAELRAAYPSAAEVGRCVAFDLAGYRLVVWVRYHRGRHKGIVCVRRVLTQSEYASDDWQESCGCRTPSSRRRTVASDKGLPRSYFRLVGEFPLREIASAEELAAAQAKLESVFQQEGDAGIDAYVEVLATLIDEYERTVHPTAAEPWQLVAHLLEVRHISRESLAKEARVAAATLTGILDEHRAITPATAVKLGRFFSLPVELFLSRRDGA